MTPNNIVSNKRFKQCDLHYLYWDSEEWGGCPICVYQKGLADKLADIKNILQEDFGTRYENEQYLAKQTKE